MQQEGSAQLGCMDQSGGMESTISIAFNLAAGPYHLVQCLLSSLGAAGRHTGMRPGAQSRVCGVIALGGSQVQAWLSPDSGQAISPLVLVSPSVN